MRATVSLIYDKNNADSSWENLPAQADPPIRNGDVWEVMTCS